MAVRLADRTLVGPVPLEVDVAAALRHGALSAHRLTVKRQHRLRFVVSAVLRCHDVDTEPGRVDVDPRSLRTVSLLYQARAGVAGQAGLLCVHALVDVQAAGGDGQPRDSGEGRGDDGARRVRHAGAYEPRRKHVTA